MGTGAELIPYAVAALSAGAGAYNADRTAKRQSEAATRGILAQQAKQREATARVNQQIGEIGQSTPEDERAAATDQFLAQLRANRAQTEGPQTLGGSDRFRQDTEAAKVGIQNYGENAANVLARMTAPIEQRRGEGYGIGRAGVDIGTISNAAAGEDFLNRLRMSQIKRNPWIDAASQVGMSYAQGAAGAMKNPNAFSFNQFGSGAAANSALRDAGFG